MSTPNFHSKCGKYFIIDDSDWDEFMVEDHMESLRDVINEKAEKAGFKVSDGVDDDTIRSYSGIGLTHIGFTRMINGVYEYSIGVNVVIRPGYYTHANIDYTVTLYDEFGEWDFLDFDDIVYWENKLFTEYAHDYNNGFAKIIYNKAYFKTDEDYDTLTSFIDTLLKELCDEQLVLEGIFSNGEAIYSRAG